MARGSGPGCKSGKTQTRGVTDEPPVASASEEHLHGPMLAEMRNIPTEYRPLDSDGEWLVSGGCVHLAIALKDVFPEGKIAVSWYSDHGRLAISHAAFYDPASGRAWDGCGTWDSWQVAISGHSDETEREEDADPAVIAAHMGIAYNPDAPFENDLLMEAWEFAERHFLPEYHAQRLAEYGDEDDF